MARVFVDSEQIEGGIVTITDKDDIHHITRVLRLGCGDRIDVSDKTEYEYECEIIAPGEGSTKPDGTKPNGVQAEGAILAKVIESRKFAREPGVKVTLFQGIPKSGKMESIIQKCVELGIYEIVPVWTERTVVTDKGNFAKKIDRWQKIAGEAVKQCRRGIIPEIACDMKLKDAASMFSAYDLVMLAYEGEEKLSIKDCIERSIKDCPDGCPETVCASDLKHTAGPANIAIIIGPEGGFSDGEAKFLTEAGAHSVTLGKTILRTETAGPAMLAMIMYALEL